MNTSTSGTGARASAVLTAKSKAFSAAFAVLLISLCIAGTAAHSAAMPGDPPIYNAASKSYFQLLTQTTQKQSWRFAYAAALSKTFRGVRGRLAVIDRPETHQFILRNFDLTRPIWIGLRYLCRFRMLEWNGSRPYAPGDPGHFHAWHPQWYRNTQTMCASGRSLEESYMPFYYETIGVRNARWQASGPAKFFGRFLVEFPTGEE